MRRQQIELLTIQAVDRVLNGLGNEDSLVEFKSIWPDPEKPRQLAGHANSARGEEILWIIGVDEQSGVLTQPPPVDLADWWARMSKGFDGQVVPELTDLQVPIENGTVTALLFQTDRAPYVINSKGGGGEKEIPIPTGTRTRSANRFEILRLLTPAVALPQCLLLEANVDVHERQQRVSKANTWQLQGFAKLYVDQRVGESTFFPRHKMQGTIAVKNGSEATALYPLSIGGPWSGTDQGNGTKWRPDGALSDGPTAFDTTFQASGDGKIPEEFTSATQFDLDLTFGVAGSDRPIILSAKFQIFELKENSTNTVTLRQLKLRQIVAA